MSRHPVADQGERNRLVTELDRTSSSRPAPAPGRPPRWSRRSSPESPPGGWSWSGGAITFTIAAAGELRVRIREELEAAAAGAVDVEQRLRLAQAASEVDRARIETIHAFCSALLRMHPLEAGLPPDFETLADLAGDLEVRSDSAAGSTP